jgi:hypothetical protein
MNWDATTITVIGAIAVALITIVGNFVVTYLTKRFEYKKSLHTIIYDCAYKEWEYTISMLKLQADLDGEQLEVRPFPDFLFFYSRFVRLIEEQNIKESDITKFFNDQTKIQKIYNQERDKFTEKSKAP